jgi:serine/threonine protein kinase
MKLPRRFGRYELVERIAVGGTAEIYRAVLNSTDGFSKTVAIKTLLPQLVGSDELSHLLIDEARVLCHLSHQSIVQVYELGDEGGIPFMAMEYVDGIDCARLLIKIIRGEAPLSTGLVLYIIASVLSALKLAHERKNEKNEPIGIVHRDVSPSNILLSWDGEVKVTDFGIAKGSHRSQLTDAGQMRGKYSYMSPEQARGEPIDHRSDIFACGIIMYELLTGRRLFSGKTDADVLSAVECASADTIDLEGLPPNLGSILLLALAADREVRYQSAGEMLDDVRNAMLTQGEIPSSAELKSHLEESFADYIEEAQDEERDRREPTRPTRVLGYEARSQLRRRLTGILTPWWRVAAILLISMGLMGTHPADGSVELRRPSSKNSDVQSVDLETPAFVPPEIKGVIAIDTEPSGAKGILTIGDRRLEITTPFARSDIDVDGQVKGNLELSMPGFKTYSEMFELSPNSNAIVREIPMERMAAARLYVGARPWGIASVKGYAGPRETPISGVKVKAGSHLITVSHPPSGKRLTRRVSVGEGQVRKCLADFRGGATMKCM